MVDTPVSLTRKSLKTPRAAAVAGIIFALLYGTSLTLIYLSIPPEPGSGSAAWLESNYQQVSLALNLIPYAGIAFLWFIGVIRDLISEVEDHLFSTIFLGSGLLFLALTFVGAAFAGGLLAGFASSSQFPIESSVFAYGRLVMYQITHIYAIRMAGLFMISLGTIFIRTGVMHRGWAYLTYALALVLLLSISFSILVAVIFPAWVLTISVLILVRNRNGQTVREPGGA
jgi:hypothetical protein